MILESLIIILLIIANGIFAMSEIAVVSSRKSRLQQMADEGDQGAKTALRSGKYAKRVPFYDSDRHHIGGNSCRSLRRSDYCRRAISGAQRASFPSIAPYSQILSIGIVVLGITYLTLDSWRAVSKKACT